MLSYEFVHVQNLIFDIYGIKKGYFLCHRVAWSLHKLSSGSGVSAWSGTVTVKASGGGSSWPAYIARGWWRASRYAACSAPRKRGSLNHKQP